jgi:hypothetical protein
MCAAVGRGTRRERYGGTLPIRLMKQSATDCSRSPSVENQEVPMTWHRDVQHDDNVFVAIETTGYYACVTPVPRTLEDLHTVAKTFAATYPFSQSADANPADVWILAEIAPIVVRATGDAERWAVEVGTPTGYFAFNAAGVFSWATPRRNGARAYSTPCGAA